MKNLDKDNIIGVAALLVHAAKIDEHYTNDERVLVKKFIKSYLKDDNEEDILIKAEEVEKNSNQLLSFTNIIKKNTEEIKSDIIKHLWEIITRPRSEGGLFNDGVNLILFNSPEDDDSNKIELICLANEVNYDSRKKSVILYTKNDYYEPICMIEKLGTKKYKVKKQFDHDEISRHLPKIKTLMNKCTALSRKPTNKYNFVNNIS